MTSTNGLVREVLARHLDRASSRIEPEMALVADLDITPLELVLVALEVEDREDVPMPVEELVDVRTVGDLMSFVANTVTRARGRQASACHSAARGEAFEQVA